MTVSRRDLVGRAALSAGLGGVSGVLAQTVGPDSALAAEAPRWATDARTFGAVGDGVSDDGAAIQRAIDSLPTIAAQAEAGGGVVAIPPGVFRIERTLGLNHGITLQGAGHKATVLRASPDLQGPIVAFDRDGLPPSSDRIVLRDLFIRGARVPGQTGVFLRNVHSWTISNVWVGWCDLGVHLVATWVGDFRNARATHNRTYGLLTETSPDGGPHQIVFTAALFDRNRIGMVLDGSQYCWLLGCSLERNDVGGLLLSSVRNVSVHAHFEANGHYNIAVSPDPKAHRPSRNVTIAGSTLSLSSKDRRVTGVVAGAVSELDIRNNWFLKRANDASIGVGVALGSGVRNAQICPRTNTFQGLDHNVVMGEGERLAGAGALNGGTLPVSLFGGWPELAHFAASAYDPSDSRNGLDVIVDMDVDGPLDFAPLPAGTRVRGSPGRRTRLVRVAGDRIDPGGAAITLRREGQSVENLRVEVEDAASDGAGVFLDGPHQAVLDVVMDQGTAVGVRVGPRAVGGLVRDVVCSGSGPALDDSAGLAVVDNLTVGRSGSP